MKKNVFLLILIITTLAIFVGGCGTADEGGDVVDADNDKEVEEEIEELEDSDADEDDQDHDHDTDSGMAPDLIYHDENGEHAYLKNLEGQEISLEDYRGKIVFLNFWATWCGFCDEEMPDLQRLSDENDDIVVLAVDVREEQDVVEEYINEGGYSFEVVLDTTGEVAESYYVSGLPTTYTIREDGSISRFFPGMLTYEQMEELLEIARSGE